MAKRANGEGSIYQRKSDGKWVGSISLADGGLHKALDNAVKWNLVPRNVCDAVTPPRIPRKELNFLSPEQAQILLKKVKEHRLEALLTLAITTGMRRGELLALRWQDIDF